MQGGQSVFSQRIIKPFLTPEWWVRSLPLVQELTRGVPCYTLHFDTTDNVVDLIEALASKRRSPAPPE